VLTRERTKEILAEHERRLARQARAEALASEREIEAAAEAAEAARRDELIGEAARWHQAQQIRAYVEAAAPLDANVSAAFAWRAWALNVADDVCPLPARLRSFGVEG
jgi:hypothetical protein